MTLESNFTGFFLLFDLSFDPSIEKHVFCLELSKDNDFCTSLLQSYISRKSNIIFVYSVR